MFVNVRQQHSNAVSSLSRGLESDHRGIYAIQQGCAKLQAASQGPMQVAPTASAIVWPALRNSV